MKRSTVLIRISLTCSLLVLLIFAVRLHAQETQSLPVKVALRLADEKDTFRSGDPVRLVLSFTSETSGYVINETVTKPMLSLDELNVSPKQGVFPWLTLTAGSSRYTDYAGLRELSDKPSLVTFTANDFVRFDTPGVYTISVRTMRAYKGEYKLGNQIPLETNAVKITILPMTLSDESQEITRLDQLIDSSKDIFVRERYTEELGYLSGDLATREKVKQILDPAVNDGNYFRALSVGLSTSRNRELVISMLEAALKDPLRIPRYWIIGKLCSLRILNERAAKWTSKPDTLNLLAASDADRVRAVKSEYIEKLKATLPARAGQSQIQAAIILLEYVRGEGAAGQKLLGAIRPVILKGLEDLHVDERNRVLTAFWGQLKDPILAPVLEKTLRESQDPTVRGNGLTQLYELDPARARPFFVEEIMDPYSRVDIAVLDRLNDEMLPEADEELLNMITQSDAKDYDPRYLLESQTARLARFASAAIYQQIKSLYEEKRASFPMKARGSLLAYLARHSQSDADAIIRTGLKDFTYDEAWNWWKGLTETGYSPLVEQLLTEQIDRDEGSIAAEAAWRLSKYSRTAASKAKLIARLDRWRKDWGGRIAEIDSEGSPDALRQQAGVEREIVLGLLNAKAWKLSDPEAERLKQSCLSKWCKAQFPKTTPPGP